tara:strand:- start:308 stop:1045 length:738 start_codon:yes stop_codon:yes gene_type:complete
MQVDLLEKLKDDTKYYGDFGKEYLSASDVSTLLYQPEKFKEEKKSPEILMGRYFHQIILEPDKPIKIPIFDSSTRSTKKFKDYLIENNLDKDDVMLLHERDTMLRCKDKLLSVLEISEIIQDTNNKYEVPAIMEIEGNMWKSKCDILHEDFVVDLKTTGNAKNFRSSARAFCYNSQAYVYELQFKKPMLFVVIDKNTLQVLKAPCSDEFLAYGKQNVFNATQVYNKYFSKNKTHDISQHVTEMVL